MILTKPLLAGLAAAGLLAAGAGALRAGAAGGSGAATQLHDGSDGRDWPGFGRTYGEQHFSPLTEVNVGNVGKLGLAWSMDLPPGNSVSGPLAVDGVLYFTTFYSIVHAVDAVSGRELWVYDPKAPEASGPRLRQGWGSRGLAWWNGKVYTATQDGRLIALDARTGKPVWSVQTLAEGDPRFISGPPRAFDGKVIIGNAGADEAPVRGDVSAFDAETGRKLWRVYTVPGDPAKGFESPAMAMAAKTWAGEWWKYGGGGTAWNAITYDAETRTVLIGTGNGAPWNRKIRSAGTGDNLFLCSILALDADTGAYKWHYQINPGETWDFNAAMDMELGDLVIAGKPRKVVMTAPKNGFFYVIDRLTGKLISAEPFVPQTWAKKIDLASGRPIDMPNNRYENGVTTIMPTPVGAHSWLPMAFSPQTGLVYIPAIKLQVTYDDRAIDRRDWKFRPGLTLDYGVDSAIGVPPGKDADLSDLVAWNPVTQRAAWRVPTPAHFNGGVLATGGRLVFQGQIDSRFNAYDAGSGKRLWSFAAQAPVIAPPTSYMAGGRQYVTVLTGLGTSGGFMGALLAEHGIRVDYRTQARRVLTFAIGGKATLPRAAPFVPQPIDDPDYRPDAASAARGATLYNQRCVVCHGGGLVAAGVAPDLRTSGVPLSEEAFAAVVHDGALVPAGMPRFEQLTAAERNDLRQYIRTEAKKMGQAQPVTVPAVR